MIKTLALLCLCTVAHALTPAQALQQANACAKGIKGATVRCVAPTGSMWPAITERSILVIEPVPFSALRAGDAVEYHSWRVPGTTITHRLVRITSKGWLVKGDACNQFDPEKVTAQNFVGKVVAVFTF